MRYGYRKINQAKQVKQVNKNSTEKEVCNGYSTEALMSLSIEELNILLEKEWKKGFYLKLPYLG